MRLALEGSRAFEMGGGVLTPGLELGLRHNGGDAETGAGVEIGGRVTYADPDSGLSVEARGLSPGGGTFEPERRLEGEFGYGLALFGDRFTGTPNLGFGLSDGARDYRIGWRLTSAVRGDPGFEVNLDATRRESANDNEPAGHGVMLRGAICW